MGGNSQQYTTSALTLTPGSKSYVIHSRASLVKVGEDNWSNMTGAGSYHFGFTRNVEFGITGILYQDLNLSSTSTETESKTTNVPDRLILRWKYGNKQIGQNPFYYGFQGTANTRFSSSAVSNVSFEPYISDKLSMQFNALFSYIGNPLYPDDALQIHYNIGYINYGDSGQLSTSAEAIKVSCAYVFPLNARMVLNLESQGTYFLGFPTHNIKIFSSEDYGYITPSVNWKIVPGITFMSGVDVKVYEQKTDVTILPSGVEFPNYPVWRITSKIIINASSVSGPSFSTATFQGGGGLSSAVSPMAAPAVGSGYTATNRAALYDWGGSVKDDVQYIEVELEKIREDRRKAEEKLNKIKSKIQNKNRK
ncbi:MAG: hypothetical protein P9L92_01085 [Candidatus Electryonea clarkiae]|nr:hypothetical protein [Candidatus Electryonea clarkiae]MDP8289162.1 hypothetical protein [Candidatus Electryonea clarkiae]